MKAIKILLVAVILGIGIGQVQANTLNKEMTVEQMEKEVERSLVQTFNNIDMSQFVEDGKKIKVVVTLKVCKSCCIEVVKIEGASEEIQELLKKTINTGKVKTDEICKYRRFRVPLTLMYRK